MKNSILTLLFVTICISLYAQDDYSRSVNNKSKFWDKVYFGGGASVGFGTITQIQAYPRIGYAITDDLIAGVGINYLYSKINYTKLYGSGGTVSSSIYGGTLFSSYRILENIAAQVEYEALNWEFYDIDILDYRRDWINSFFIGGSYRQPIGRKGFVELTLLYNLSYENQKVSPYSSPWVPRISFYF